MVFGCFNLEVVPGTLRIGRRWISSVEVVAGFVVGKYQVACRLANRIAYAMLSLMLLARKMNCFCASATEGWTFVVHVVDC